MPLGRRIFRRDELRAERVHVGRHHPGAELRDHARHAPQQASLVASRRLHHGRRMDLRHLDGVDAPHRGVRLPEVRRLPPVRNR